MSSTTEAISTAELVDVCEAVEPGDQVELSTVANEYTNPLEVLDVEVVEWLNPNGNWFTARLVVESSTGYEHPITAVEGEMGPRDRPQNNPYKVTRLAPVTDEADEDEEESDYWCGRCGYGPSSEIGVKRHNGIKHDGGPILWDVEPDDEDALPGDGEALPTDENDVVQFTDYGADPGNGVTCQNCGAHTTKDYGKVMDPDEEHGPVCCPNCPDLTRSMGEVREKRSGGGQSTVVNQP